MKEYKQSPPNATEIHKPKSDACARCRRPAPVRGRFSATINDVKKFICAACCSELGSVGALIRHAEAADRESQRARFQPHRRVRMADRRAA